MSTIDCESFRSFRQLFMPKIMILGLVEEPNSKVTYIHPRAQNQDFELPRYSRVLESSPDGFYLWSSLVLSIPRVSEPSDNFSSQKSGFWGKSWDQCTKYQKRPITTSEPKIEILGSEVDIGHFRVWFLRQPQNHDFWNQKLSDGAETFRIDSTREFHK